MISGTTITEKRFLAYIQKLRNELDTAYTHYEIAKYLREFRYTRHSDFVEAQTFFFTTLDSNLFSAIMIIWRGFIDKDDDCLQMNEFFKLVRPNLTLFSTEAYEKRLEVKGINGDQIDDLVRRHVEITEGMVDEDEAMIKSLPNENLKSWRNKMLAHIDKTRALNNTDIMKTNPITVSEIDTILSTLDKVLNRYSISYDGVGYQIGLPPVKRQMEYIMNALNFYRDSRMRKK
jgi:hypothetical protein